MELLKKDLKNLSRVRIILTASSPRIGLTFYFSRLAISLKRKKYDVIVLSDVGEEFDGLSTDLKSEGIEHHTVKGLDAPTNLSSIKELSKVMKRTKFDLIHTSGLIKLAKFRAAMLLTNTRAPLILHIDNISDTKTKSIEEAVEVDFVKKFVYASFSFFLNACTDMIIPVSNWTKKRLHNYRVNGNKMTVIHNFIDLELFDSNVCGRSSLPSFLTEMGNKTIIVHVSNLHPWKGLRFLLYSAKKILETNSNCHFLIVGEGPMRKELEYIAHKLGIFENVTFTGHVTNDQIAFLLSNAAICVLASLKEQFPRVLLEYMAAAKPIVATNVGGVPEAVIDGVNGYIVPSGDSKSLTEAILRLIKNPDEAREMGAKGRRIVEQEFGIDVIAPKLTDAYESVLQ